MTIPAAFFAFEAKAVELKPVARVELSYRRI